MIKRKEEKPTMVLKDGKFEPVEPDGLGPRGTEPIERRRGSTLAKVKRDD